MVTSHFTFRPDLNSFLAPSRREGAFAYSFENGQSVKHLIEAAGVPHTEVGRIVVNSRPTGFEYQVQQDDRVIVFPADAANSPLPGAARFVLDNHLGRLAAYLRMLGFDVVYRNDFDDDELVQISAAEERILLTRDRRMLMRKMVRSGYCLRSLDSRKQLDEVLRRFDLYRQVLPFQRCLRCNTPLEIISKDAVLDRLEPLTRLYFADFRICPACGQIYWKGSHYEHMQEIIKEIQNRAGPES
jgi:uncharacterized protein with PIN domain